MRTFMAVPAAALLALAVAAPAMAGPSTSNQSGLGETIYGEFYSEGSYGYVYLGEENNQYGFGDIYMESGEWVDCGEEAFGFVGTRTYGWAFNVTIELSRRLESGTATGMVDLYTETVDDCAGTFEGSYELAELSVSTTGVGDLASFRGTGSYQIPSEFNGHYSYRGKERQATGSLTVGSLSAELSWGYMSQVTWIEHING